MTYKASEKENIIEHEYQYFKANVENLFINQVPNSAFFTLSLHKCYKKLT